MTEIEEIYRTIYTISKHADSDYVAASEIVKSTKYDKHIIGYLCKHEVDMGRMTSYADIVVLTRVKLHKYRITITGAQYCRDKFGFGFGPGKELKHA